MSNVSRVIGTIEIECPKCKNMTSYRKILFDNAGEFGECMKCGGLTYTKVINGISKARLTICPMITLIYIIFCLLMLCNTELIMIYRQSKIVTIILI